MNVSEIRMLREASQALFGAKCQIPCKYISNGEGSDPSYKYRLVQNMALVLILHIDTLLLLLIA